MEEEKAAVDVKEEEELEEGAEKIIIEASLEIMREIFIQRFQNSSRYYLLHVSM